jgi:hypothetical protein
MKNVLTIHREKPDEPKNQHHRMRGAAVCLVDIIIGSNDAIPLYDSHERSIRDK